MPKPRPESRLKKLARRLARGMLLLFTLILIAITSLRWINPISTSVIVQHNIEAKSTGGSMVKQDWVNWESISPQLPLAVLAAEDQRFPDHYGIDFTELKNAVRQGANRGASTITQQVAKNLFLWQSRSYLRKVLEAVLALYIDLVWGKQRVLEIYLNVAFFGANIYGVEAASQKYFGKNASKLNRYEAARLAAVLPNPRRYSAQNASAYTIDRQNWIMDQMEQLGGTRFIDNL
ncbi:MAG: monofunctional biosynthetic peptidoglycan transglycosylase [bacterium]